MGDNTNISWCDATWNPLIGCTRVSSGCNNCYAIREVHRMAGNPNPKVSAASIHTTTTKERGLDWSGAVNFMPDRLVIPLHWKRARRIFVPSLSDMFHHSVSSEQIAAIFGVMLRCPQHLFMVLTKREKRAAEWFESMRKESRGPLVACLAAMAVENPETYKQPMGRKETLLVTKSGWPPKNLYIGPSVEDQATANERIPVFMHIKMRNEGLKLMVSYEPAYGPVDFTTIGSAPIQGGHFGWNVLARDASHIDWLIAGGESGREANPSHVDWFRRVRDDCKRYKVPFHFKQWGEWIDTSQISLGGGACSPWETRDLDNYSHVIKVGKRVAGHLLDGIAHQWVPPLPV